MWIFQNGPLGKLVQFFNLFMHSSVLCIVMYGAIEIYMTCAWLAQINLMQKFVALYTYTFKLIKEFLSQECVFSASALL